jgi:DNA-binding transcriptional regulator YhcF (GntR family)
VAHTHATSGASSRRPASEPGGKTLISIDTTSGDPPYEQIRTQIAAQVASGELPPGTKLPTVRALAETLGVAVNTVARAYRELEHAGVVTTARRAGTVVSGDRVDRAAKEAAASYADVMRSLGVRQDEALRLVRRAFERPTSS